MTRRGLFQWAVRRRGWRSLASGLVLGGLPLGCDGVGPAEELGGTPVTTGWSPLEWSIDGTEIYYYSAPFQPDLSTSDPGLPLDQILAVNVATGAVRVAVSECAVRGSLPPRETIAGLAYIRSCGAAGSSSLHLVRGGRDSMLASSARWVTRTTDRTRLVYFVSPGDCVACDSTGVIDLLGGERYTVPTDLPLAPLGADAVSPEGTEMLHGGWEARVGILNLIDGTWRELVDPGLSPDDFGVELGWNQAGIWFLSQLGYTLIFHNPVSGEFSHFSTSNRNLRGGTPAPVGRATIVWSWVCEAPEDPGISGFCLRALYSMWLWNPFDGSDQLLVEQRYAVTGPETSRYTSFGAFSPDGRSFAYTVGQQIFLLSLP